MPRGGCLVPRPSSAVDFDAALQYALDQAVPGHLGGRLELRLPSGRSISVELWPCRNGRTTGGEMEQNILEALREADEPLTAEKLAETAGYSPNSGAFRQAIKNLMENNQIINARPGYRLA